MGSLGRAITLYGGIERVAIRPAHLRDGGFEHIFQLSDGRDTLMHSRSVPQGASAPQRWTKARARGLRFDCRDQGSCANDIHDAREIVGEHTERHSPGGKILLGCKKRPQLRGRFYLINPSCGGGV